MLGFTSTGNEALIAMADDPGARVRIAAFHALACDRRKGDTCAPGEFVHTDGRAVTALETACAHDPSPAVRKKAGWFTPGGTIYQRTRPTRAQVTGQPIGTISMNKLVIMNNLRYYIR